MFVVEPLLRISDLVAFYGDARALHGVSLSLTKGETLALIGANGAGKSTLLKCICGLLPGKTGVIAYKGTEIGSLAAYDIVKLGITLVPEGRRLFPSLSVEENLVLGSHVNRAGHWTLESLFSLFPVLKEKRNLPSTSLSGGQQQMVAIGRALMSNPDLILLDELSLGLAPIVIKDIYERLPDITSGGMTVILVEQDVTRALACSSRFICLQEGRVSLAGSPQEHSRDAITTAYFGT
jgi:branched-chain amino acid transport system ATP-binding protein